MKIWLFVLVLMLVVLRTSANEVIIYINSSSPLASNTTSCGNVNTPCYTFDLGLNVAQERLMETHQTAIIIILVSKGEYKHSNETNGFFKEVNGLSIIGEVSNDGDILTTITCQGKVGFSFIKTSSIKISGIIFDRCGQLQNSTSYNYNEENKGFLTFYVGLYFLYCRDVNLTFVTVSSTPGTGIVFYNIGGTNIIENSVVFWNNFSYIFHDVEDDKDIEVGGGGGGVYIEYSYCVPGEDGIKCLEGKEANVDPQYISQSNFYIHSSIFYANKANTSNFVNDTIILPRKQYHSAFGRGGGLSVFFKGDGSHNTITVDKCCFTHNQALWGAGMFVEFQDNTNNNNVLVKTSVFHTNSLHYNDVKNEGTGGGGARIGFVFFNGSVAYSNNITFYNCSFEENSAYYGGGLSFYSARQTNVDNNTQLLNSFELGKCHFINNLGRIGAALDISLWHPSITGKHPYLFIDSCTFEGNNAMYQPQPGGLIGVGAVSVDSLPVMFSGNNSFNHNSGSALVITGFYITIEPSSNLSFYNNSGRNGGAIALLGNTFIVTNEDSVLHFVNNSAQYKGGAIYYYSSGERDLLSSRNCFIRYYDIIAHPEEWTSKFYFEGNTAGYGNNINNSIYASTVLPCIWGGAYGSSEYDSDQSVFCWNNNWQYFYSPNVLAPCVSQISTAPSKYTHIKTTYQSFPGQEVNLNVSFDDDLKNTISNQAILIAHMNNTDNATFEGTDLNYDYIAHKKIELHGKPGTNVSIRLETLDPIVIQQDITVEFRDCPPGFVPSANTSTAICQCPNGTYAGYITCNPLSYTISIRKAAWMGQVAGFSDLLVGLSPYVSSSNDFKYVVLPQDPQELSNFFCGATNREGILCGDCKEGFGVAVNSEYFDCVLCPDEHTYYNWIFYLLTEFLPGTLFFVLVFVFSMTVTSGPLNSYIFFAQVISNAVGIDADGMIPLHNITEQHGISYATLKDFYVIPYDIWNMNFFKSLWPKFCLSPHLNTIDIYALGYITAVYVLILVIIFALILNLYNRGVSIVVCICRPLHKCLAHFRRLSNFQPSITGGVAVFILISYTKFAYVSLYLLTPIPLYHADGTVAVQVFYPDGNIYWGNNDSVIYIIIASCMLSTFVLLPPLVLFYPTFLRLIERLSCWRLSLGKLYPSAKIQSFMNEFHGCYKDGSNGGMDCRWFASLYFCLRIGVFAVYSGSDTWFLQYTIQLLFFLFAAFLFALIQPYQKAWLNKLDMSMFLLLATITALSQYNLGKLWIGNGQLSVFAFGVQYVLLFLPLLYCIGYFLVLIFDRTRTRWAPYVKDKYRRFKNQGIQAELIEEQDEFNTDYTALVDSTDVPNFLDFMEDSKQIEDCARLTKSRPSYANSHDQDSIPLKPYSLSGATRSSPQPSTSDGNSNGLAQQTTKEKEESENTTNQPLHPIAIDDYKIACLSRAKESSPASFQPSISDSDAIKQQTTEENIESEIDTDRPVQHPSEDYQIAHSTNRSQERYGGTIGSTLLSLTPPPL